MGCSLTTMAPILHCALGSEGSAQQGSRGGANTPWTERSDRMGSVEKALRGRRIWGIKGSDCRRDGDKVPTWVVIHGFAHEKRSGYVHVV